MQEKEQAIYEILKMEVSVEVKLKLLGAVDITPKSLKEVIKEEISHKIAAKVYDGDLEMLQVLSSLL